MTCKLALVCSNTTTTSTNKVVSTWEVVWTLCYYVIKIIILWRQKPCLLWFVVFIIGKHAVWGYVHEKIALFVLWLPVPFPVAIIMESSPFNQMSYMLRLEMWKQCNQLTHNIVSLSSGLSWLPQRTLLAPHQPSRCSCPWHGKRCRNYTALEPAQPIARTPDFHRRKPEWPAL